MRLLITGGMGYIGTNLIKSFQKKNYSIVVIDNLSTSVLKSTTEFECVTADITLFDDLISKLKGYTFDAVLHLAAQSSGPASFKNPELDLKINILGTLNIIRLCEILSIPRIIFASSFTVYGDNLNEEMLSETMPCNPKSLYGIGKLTGEQYCKVYGEKLGLKWNALRMFNVYGPGQDLSRKDQGLVSIFMSYAQEGNVIPMQGSPERFRDLVYIDDIVEGWNKCLESTVYNEVFNIGSGVKTTFKALVNEIGSQFKKDILIDVVGQTPGDMMGCYADITKAKEKLAYSPKYGLTEGLSLFKNWMDTQHA
jgi:UDP-glucose 4-epimerase